jgi:outer membrane protease
MRDSGRTTWVPLLRLDSYEQNDGKDSYSAATVNIGYYFTQNIKGFVEYSNVYDAPTSADEVSRSTVQFEAAF